MKEKRASLIEKVRVGLQWYPLRAYDLDTLNHFHLMPP